MKAGDDAVKAQGAGPSSSQEGPASGVRRIEKRFSVRRTAGRQIGLRVECAFQCVPNGERKFSSQPGAALVRVRNPERPCAPGSADDGVAAAAESNRTGRTLGVGRRPLSAPGSADEYRSKNARVAPLRKTCSSHDRVRGKTIRRHREDSGTRKAVTQSESLFVLTPEATGNFSRSSSPPSSPAGTKAAPRTSICACARRTTKPRRPRTAATPRKRSFRNR